MPPLKSQVQFEQDIRATHGDRYDLSKAKYVNAKTVVLVKCNTCQHEWSPQADSLMHGSGCPLCNFSKGETLVSQLLRFYDIVHECQKRFEDCRSSRPLPFDFFCPDQNTLIEFQGLQHFKPHETWGGVVALQQCVERDNIKKKYCEDNDIRLLLIKYDDKVEEKLLKHFNLQKLEGELPPAVIQARQSQQQRRDYQVQYREKNKDKLREADRIKYEKKEAVLKEKMKGYYQRRKSDITSIAQCPDCHQSMQKVSLQRHMKNSCKGKMMI